MDLITLAIPFFIILLALEIWIDHRKGSRLYRFNDAITDLSCGIGMQVISPLAKLLTVFLYSIFYENFSLVDLSSIIPSWALWILAFVAVDFGYYWWHRVSHRNNVIWASHVVHHQSEDYNFAVALRQAWFSSFTSLPFYLPIAVVGVPTPLFLTMLALNTIYQFWIHTELVRKIGPLEAIMNTPSHHRVHHGVNPQYLDKNYAGVFIIWDKIFGTFEPEDEKVVYGTVKPFESWNPIAANLRPLQAIGQSLTGGQGWRNKLLYLYKPPGWDPKAGEMNTTKLNVSKRVKFNTDMGQNWHSYIVLQFALTVITLSYFLFQWPQLSLSTNVFFGFFILLTTYNWGAIFEGQPWGLRLEWTRLAAGVAFLSLFASTGQPVLWLFVGTTVLSLVFFHWKFQQL